MRLAALLAIAAFVLPMSARAAEEPPHTVVVQDGKFEIRQYEPVIVAEVEETGDMRRAGNSGFGPLADFIFGNNTTRAKIEMTAPVTRTPSARIAMTAPVTRTPSGEDSWTVAFVMPPEWTMESLPRPNNPDISIREVPGELVAAVRFAGSGSERAHTAKQAELEAWLTARGYRATGPARYAGYNPPWTPGPFRRNEVMIPVDSAAPAPASAP